MTERSLILPAGGAWKPIDGSWNCPLNVRVGALGFVAAVIVQRVPLGVAVNEHEIPTPKVSWVILWRCPEFPDEEAVSERELIVFAFREEDYLTRKRRDTARVRATSESRVNAIHGV